MSKGEIGGGLDLDLDHGEDAGQNYTERIPSIDGDLEDPLDSDLAAGSFRPSLVKLATDVRRIREELLEGFSSRRAVLKWLADVAVSTLGETDMILFRDVGRGFRTGADGEDRVLLSSLLEPSARVREVDQELATELRERIAAGVIAPAYSRAFRQLRTDSTEYVDEADDEDAHNPLRQRYRAMRPALDELLEWQLRSLSTLLDGFDDVEEILEWGEVVEIATHGELSEEFIMRSCLEAGARSVLLEPDQDRAREAFAAVLVVPEFNQGVRTLRGRAGEVADADNDPMSATQL